eukprot:2253935-Rhodomonas_salina.1
MIVIRPGIKLAEPVDGGALGAEVRGAEAAGTAERGDEEGDVRGAREVTWRRGREQPARDLLQNPTAHGHG